jgi:hypothetical protein
MPAVNAALATAPAAPTDSLTLDEAATALRLPAQWLRAALANGWVARASGGRHAPRFAAADLDAIGRAIRFHRQYARQRQTARRANRAG